MARFYLGTNKANWLYGKGSRHPLFLSVRTLDNIKNLRPALVDWCLDSGGFTELTLYNEWRTTPQEYIDKVQRVSEMGRLMWASPQDWMCEPHMIAKTGRTVEEHQHRTCENYATLRDLGPGLPIIPVLQGWHPDDYRRHVDIYGEYGIDLRAASTVGLGSFCRRANVAGVRELVIDLAASGLGLHGFGLKQDGLRLFGNHLQSSDSMAWSLAGRFAGQKGQHLCGQPHRAKSCADCWDWAQMWGDQVAGTQQTVAPLLWEAVGC